MSQAPYTGQNKNGRTLRDLFEFNIDIKPVRHNGVIKPGFILQTKLFDEAQELLRTYPLNIFPTSISMLRALQEAGKLAPGTVVPKKGTISIEISMDDFDPYHILGNVVVKEEMHQELMKTNFDSKDFAIILQEKKRGLFVKERVKSIPHRHAPHIIDWSGIYGIIFNTRRTTNSGPNQISILQQWIEQDGRGTGVRTELGYLYRLADDWDSALEWYRAEIQYSLELSGELSFSSARALSNMGVIYKKAGHYQAALDCFHLALYLNPNYFESLVSVVGITTDPDRMLRLLARAYRIRPGFPLFKDIFMTAQEMIEIPADKLSRQVIAQSKKVSLLKPIDQILDDDPNEMLDRLGV